MTTKTAQLSSAMQAMMWKALALETGAWRNRYAWQHADGRLVLGARVTASTYVALASRGLIEHDRTELTDAGRAWIAEQIDAAHVEALDIEAERTHDAFMAGRGSIEAADLAERHVVRANRLSISEAFLVEDDHDEALRLNAALDSRNALWAREHARTTDAA